MIGRVYAIVDTKNPDYYLYIGSTVTSLKQRRSNHSAESKRSPNIKLYKYILEHGLDQFELTLLYKGLFVSLNAMHIHEEHYRLMFEPPLNSYKCSRGDITMDEYQKEYRRENKQTLRAMNRQRYEQNKDSISTKRKQYYGENRESILAKNQTRNKERVDCECGLPTTYGHLYRHSKSNKHNKRMVAIVLNEIIDQLCV